MKAAILLPLVLGGLYLINPSRALTQQSSVHSPVTLYSVKKYRGEHRNVCLNLLTGAAESNSGYGRCDVLYGFLQAGDELDWFQSSEAKGHRSVIRDLGELAWTSSFAVPLVAALPKLKPGEQRRVSIDVSGADGADGAPGARGEPGRKGADADGVVRDDPRSDPAPVVAATKASSAQPDGKPKIDSMFVKARVGHLYIIHVVDDVNDFYALFRVEALERGDKCTISWRLIPPPDTEAAQSK